MSETRKIIIDNFRFGPGLQINGLNNGGGLRLYLSIYVYAMEILRDSHRNNILFALAEGTD